MYVIRLLEIDRHQRRQLLWIFRRRDRWERRSRNAPQRAEAEDDFPQPTDRLRFRIRHVIGHAGYRRVHVGATQSLAVDDLVDRSFDDGRSTEMDAPGAANHHDLVGQGRNVGATCRAAAEHRRNLRNAGSRHAALVVKRPAKVIAIRKHAILLGKERAATVDQINAGKPVLLSDLLRPQMFSNGFGEERATFDGGVVCDNHARRVVHEADAGDDTCRRQFAIIKTIGGERREFEKRARRIQQKIDPVANRNLSTRAMSLDECRAAALQHRSMPIP